MDLLSSVFKGLTSITSSALAREEGLGRSAGQRPDLQMSPRYESGTHMSFQECFPCKLLAANGQEGEQTDRHGTAIDGGTQSSPRFSLAFSGERKSL